MATLKIVGGIKDNFTLIPNDIFRDPDISPRAVKVYGFLRSHTSGFRINVRGIATQMGMGKNSVNAAIQELENAGYIAREWKQEGNLRTGIEYLVFDSRCPHSRDTENRVYRESGLPETGTHKEDQFLKEDQSFKEDQSLASARSSETPEAFDEWWKHYPKKVGKGQARKAFKAALKKTTLEELSEATKRFSEHHRAAGTEKRFIPNPATWLNGERWGDELVESRAEQSDRLRQWMSEMNFDDEEVEVSPF
ncbi:helix-turn-helix domain-containing protein [Corynebacterium striatum]